MYFLVVIKEENVELYKHDFLNPVLDYIDEQKLDNWLVGSLTPPNYNEEDFIDLPVKPKVKKPVYNFPPKKKPVIIDNPDSPEDETDKVKEAFGFTTDSLINELKEKNHIEE